jgi:hypothetical protein
VYWQARHPSLRLAMSTEKLHAQEPHSQRCYRSTARIPCFWATAAALSFLRRLGSLDQQRRRSEIRGMQEMLGVRPQCADRYTGGRALEQTRHAPWNEHGCSDLLALN